MTLEGIAARLNMGAASDAAHTPCSVQFAETCVDVNGRARRTERPGRSLHEHQTILPRRQPCGALIFLRQSSVEAVQMCERLFGVHLGDLIRGHDKHTDVVLAFAGELKRECA